MPKISITQACQRAGITPQEFEAYRPALEGDYRTPGGQWRSGVVPRLRELTQTGSPGPTVQADAPTITGLTPADRIPDGPTLWARAIERQQADEAKAQRRYHQHIALQGGLPVAVAFLSDTHFGNAHTDYEQALADAATVRDTPGMYAALLGDYFDNWITVKLAHIQREQPFRLVEEHALLRHWFEVLTGSILACVAGNHDNRTYELAGLDWLMELLKDVHCLYDQHEILFTFTLGAAEWRVKLRHQWPGFSIYNQTHGVERDARFVDVDWDIGVAGHTHTGTLFREFAHGGRRKVALQIGSYEYDSAYARKLDCSRAPAADRGCGALLFYPDGRFQPFRDLQTCAEFLTWLRSRA